MSAPTPLEETALPPLAVAAIDHGEQAVLRALLAFVCIWELAGLAKHPKVPVPTISSCMWRMPVWKRLAVWGVAGAVLTDHFIWRRWT